MFLLSLSPSPSLSPSLSLSLSLSLSVVSSDLYWEQHYTSLAMPGREQDEVFDSGLADYPLPEQIERLIEAGVVTFTITLCARARARETHRCRCSHIHHYTVC